MFNEFKKFALKGNMLDLAIGVIIGGAFGKIVTSLVNDIIMPLLGLLIGNIDFTNLFLTLGEGNFKTIEEASKAGVPTLNYGLFLNNIIDFIIIAFSIFIVIKQLQKFKRREESLPNPVNKKSCEFCFSEVHIDATRCPFCTSSLQ